MQLRAIQIFLPERIAADQFGFKTEVLLELALHGDEFGT